MLISSTYAGTMGEEKWLVLNIVQKWKQPEEVPVESSNERLLNAMEGEQVLGVGKTNKEVIEVRNKGLMEKSLHEELGNLRS